MTVLGRLPKLRVLWRGHKKGGKLHLPNDNENLDAAQYAAARQLIDRARRLHEGAASYVDRHRLDRNIFMPGNIWAHLNKESGFANWTYDLVNYSRAISPFSGFHLMLWGRSDIPGDIDEAQAQALYADLFSARITGPAIGERLSAMGLPAKIEASRASLFHMYTARKNMIGTYAYLVRKIPARFHLALPPKGGEIGILYDGRIVNPDVLAYQSRINALYGSGMFHRLEKAIAERGSANYLEVGPGACAFAYALREMFGGRLNVYLIDLPAVIANGIAYVTCVAGPEAIGVATPEEWPPHKPFIFVANYLVPACLERFPKFDLVHNALSLNEMTAQQVAYYLNLINDCLSADGVFHLVGGGKLLSYHQDALAAAGQRLQTLASYDGGRVGDVPVIDWPHTFFGSGQR